MIYKAVMFDIDGTLVFTDPNYIQMVVGQTVRDCGGVCSEETAKQLWFESGRNNTISECFGVTPAVFWEVWKKYRTIDLMKPFVRPYDDVGIIQELKEKGIKIGVVTGAPRDPARYNLLLVGGVEIFDAVVLANAYGGINVKPDPEGLEVCMTEMGVWKDEVFYVGNAREDVLAARRAGVLDVLIDRGEYEFEGLEASMMITSLDELRPLFGLE